MSERVCSKRVKHCREARGGCMFSISTHHTERSAEAFRGKKGMKTERISENRLLLREDPRSAAGLIS